MILISFKIVEFFVLICRPKFPKGAMIWKIRMTIQNLFIPLCVEYEDVIAPILVTGVNLTLFFVFILVNLLAAAI